MGGKLVDWFGMTVVKALAVSSAPGLSRPPAATRVIFARELFRYKPMSEGKKKILVIEDDAEVRGMLAHYLDYLDYEVETAKDGLDGLKKIKSGVYDLVITDIAMPYISGIGIISMLKEEYPEVPVMAITGYGYHAEELAEEKNANAIVSKPFDIHELRKIIEELIK